MKQPDKLFLFILFLEEFLVWKPGHISTIGEIVTRAAASSVGERFVSYVGYLNPVLCLVLFLVSVGPIAEFFQALIPYDLKIRVNRIGWMLKAVILVVLIYQIMQILNTPSTSNNLLQIYQNKSLWGIIFVGWAANQLIAGDKK